MTCPVPYKPRICAYCRKNPEKRAKFGAPDICPEGWTADKLPVGLGDLASKVLTPIARALGLPCVDKQTGQLKPSSPCGKRKAALNSVVVNRPL